MHGLDLVLYSHRKEHLRDGVRTRVISKGKIPSTRGSEAGQTCDAASCWIASSTLPFELFRPG